MTRDAVTVHGHRLTPGTWLHHAKLGAVRITAITPGHDDDPRLEIQPHETDARDWFVLTASDVRDAWGDTITPTHRTAAATIPHTPPTQRVRNQPRADGGRVVDDTHDCIPRIDQTTDTERCQLCGQLLDR